MDNVNITTRKIKSAIKKSILPDSYYLQKYSVSPYMACAHGCKYCDGRAERYYVEGDFEKDLVVRDNLPEVFANQIGKLRERGTIFFGSGITDSYQPIESQWKIMAQISKIMLQYNCSASVLTKSALIQRDIDNWDKLHQKNGFTFLMTIAFADEELREIFEPGASTLQARFETLAKFKTRGIPIGISGMPFLPFIGDSHRQIDQLIGKLAELKIEFFIPGTLTLRPGRQKELYMQTIKQYFPRYYTDYQNLYSDDLPSGIGKTHFHRELHKLITSSLREYQIPTQIPHYIYQGRFPIYDEIYILLSHMFELYYGNKSAMNRLNKSYRKYAEWLKSEKKVFNRKRSISQFQLEEKFRILLKNGEIEKIIDNKKLAEFLIPIVEDSASFDYIKLKLV